MKPKLFRFADSGRFLTILLILWPYQIQAAEPKVQIHSPKEGSRLTHEQKSILVSGKITTAGGRSDNADIVFVLDASGSTALHAGADFAGAEALPDTGSSGWSAPQITIGGMSIGKPALRNVKNSILAAEVVAARRLLLQLNSQTTRIGVVTFSDGAKLLQPLTHDFDSVRRALDEVLKAGPYGGTNIVQGIRTGISELMGFGSSEKRPDAIKVEFLLTDGFPTMPIGGGKRATPEDTHLAINAARIAGRAGIKVHVFALGEEALSFPRAAVGIAKESRGTYTPVARAADVLAVLDKISVVGVDFVQVFNETINQSSSHLRLAADGFFSSAVPVTEGLNRIRVSARASDGSIGRETVSVHYQPGGDRSLDLEVFLDKEKRLDLEVERLGKTPEQIQREIDSSRQVSGNSPAVPPVESSTPR
jgi:Mg-chelatase subunit ChlD